MMALGEWRVLLYQGDKLNAGGGCLSAVAARVIGSVWDG